MADPVISPPEVALTSPLEHSRRQLEALLEVSEAIAQQRDLPALFHDLSDRLRSVIDFDFLTLVLHDPARNVMRLHVLATRVPGEKTTGSESASSRSSRATACASRRSLLPGLRIVRRRSAVVFRVSAAVTPLVLLLVAACGGQEGAQRAASAKSDAVRSSTPTTLNEPTGHASR